MSSPHGRRPTGPLLPEDQAGGSASRPAETTGDVRLGVEAWLAGHGVTLPERSSQAEPVETTSRDRRGRRAEPLPEDRAALGLEADDEAVARKILLDQLTGQARSRAELTTKLARKGVPEEVGERLLDRFEEVGLVDDAAFARSWVESRQSGKGLARRALAQELRRKGIADEVAKEALAEVDEEDEDASARVLVRRKLRSVERVDRATAVRRLSGMLARKGYPPGVAFRVVKEELDEAGHGRPQESLRGPAVTDADPFGDPAADALDSGDDGLS